MGYFPLACTRSQSSLGVNDMKNLEKYLRKIVAYAGIIEGVTNAVHVPTSIRAVIVGTAGFLITVDHYLSHQTTANAVAAVKAAEVVATNVAAVIK